MRKLTSEMVRRFVNKIESEARDVSITNKKLDELCQNELHELLDEVRLWIQVFILLFF